MKTPQLRIIQARVSRNVGIPRFARAERVPSFFQNAACKVRSLWCCGPWHELGNRASTFGDCHRHASLRDSELAVFRNNTWSGGGSLDLPDGRKFLATSNFWQTKLEFKIADGADGKKLFEFQNRGLLHTEYMVTIHPEGHALPELPWMLMLGCYLAVMMAYDATAATLPVMTS